MQEFHSLIDYPFIAKDSAETLAMGLARSTGRVMPTKQIAHAMKSLSQQGNMLSVLKMVSAGNTILSLFIIMIIRCI